MRAEHPTISRANLLARINNRLRESHEIVVRTPMLEYKPYGIYDLRSYNTLNIFKGKITVVTVNVDIEALGRSLAVLSPLEYVAPVEPDHV
jgi:hypothetical protein